MAEFIDRFLYEFEVIERTPVLSFFENVSTAARNMAVSVEDSANRVAAAMSRIASAVAEANAAMARMAQAGQAAPQAPDPVQIAQQAGYSYAPGRVGRRVVPVLRMPGGGFASEEAAKQLGVPRTLGAMANVFLERYGISYDVRGRLEPLLQEILEAREPEIQMQRIATEVRGMLGERLFDVLPIRTETLPGDRVRRQYGLFLRRFDEEGMLVGRTKLAEITEEMDRLGRVTARTRRVFNDLGAGFTEVAVRADEVSRRVSILNSRFFRHLTWIAQGIAIYMGYRAVVRVLSDVINTQIALNDASVRFGLITRGNLEAMQQFREEARQILRDVQIPIESVTPALSMALRAGRPELARVALQGQEVFGVPAETIMRDIIALQTQFPGLSPQRMMDIITAAMGVSPLTPKELLSMTELAGPLTREFNTNLETFIGMVASLSTILGEGGARIELAMRQLARRVYEDPDVRSLIEEFTGRPVQQIRGGFIYRRPIEDILADIARLPAEQQAQIIGAIPAPLGQQTPQVIAALFRNWQQVQQTIDALENSAGAFSEAVEQSSLTWERATQRLAASFDYLWTSVQAMPQIISAINALADAIRAIADTVNLPVEPGGEYRIPDTSGRIGGQAGGLSRRILERILGERDLNRAILELIRRTDIVALFGADPELTRIQTLAERPAFDLSAEIRRQIAQGRLPRRRLFGLEELEAMPGFFQVEPAAIREEIMRRYGVAEIPERTIALPRGVTLEEVIRMEREYVERLRETAEAQGRYAAITREDVTVIDEFGNILGVVTVNIDAFNRAIQTATASIPRLIAEFERPLTQRDVSQIIADAERYARMLQEAGIPVGPPATVGILTPEGVTRIEGLPLEAIQFGFSRFRQMDAEGRREAERMARELRSVFDRLTRPTPVTQEQLIMAEFGAYEDQWDEIVRRLRDPVMRRVQLLGGAQLGPFADLARSLGIDLADPGRALRSLQDFERRFYGGLMPREFYIQFGAFERLTRDFQRWQEERAGRERMFQWWLDFAREQGVDVTLAKEFFAQQIPVVQMLTGGATTEEIESALGPVSSAITEGVTGGLQEEFQQRNLVKMVADVWTEQLATEKNTRMIVQIGKTLGEYMVDGMSQSMRDSILAAVINAISQAIAEETQ